MSQDTAASQGDVVKKGSLKYKASKVKGTAGSSVQGPKSSKLVFIAFRAMNSGEKIFHLYSSEKKYQEADTPKWEMNLVEASSVYFLTDKKCFCISLNDGGLLFLDASTLEEADEWVRCLNAVLFAKGINGEDTLQYEVEMMPSPLLPYHGPCVLELREHDLIIWKSDTWDEVVRWKLNHLRSFKAKKFKLTITAGKRSSTGLGEFIFKCKHSLQITHAIETVVAKVKYRSSPPPSNSHSQKTKSPVESTHSVPPPPPPRSVPPISIPDIRDPIMDTIHNSLAGNPIMTSVPNFVPPDVYDTIQDTPYDEYGKLDYVGQGGPVGDASRPKNLPLSNGANNNNPPSQEAVTGYGKLNHPSTRGSLSPPNRRSPPERLTPSCRVNNHSTPIGDHPVEEYGKLDHNSRAKSPCIPLPQLSHSKPGYEDFKGPSPQIKPSRPGYEDIDLDFSQKAPILVPKIKPSKPGYEDIDLDLDGATNAVCSISVPKAKSPSLNRRGVPPPKPAPYKQSNSPAMKPKFQKPLPPPHQPRKQTSEPPKQPEEYGRLDHSVGAAVQDMYESLDDRPLQVVHPKRFSHNPTVSPSLEDYGELDHNINRAWEGNRTRKLGGSLKASKSDSLVLEEKSSLAPQAQDSYAVLHNVMPAQTRMKLRHTVHGQTERKNIENQEEYGKLHHDANISSNSKSSHKPIPFPKPNSLMSPQEEYGHLDRKLPTHTKFDPYGSLPSETQDPEKISIKSNSSADSGTKIELNDNIEEESSGVAMYSMVSKPKKLKKKTKSFDESISSRSAPPSGYENTTPITASNAQMAATVGASSASPPLAPPRSPQQARKRYQNVGADGRILVEEAPDAVVHVHMNGKGPSSLTSPPESAAVGVGTSSSKPIPAARPKTKPKPKLS